MIYCVVKREMKKLTAILAVFILCAVYCTGFAFGDELANTINMFRPKMGGIMDVFGKYCNDGNMIVRCELFDGKDFANSFTCNFKDNIDENQLLADLRQHCGNKSAKSDNDSPFGETVDVDDLPPLDPELLQAEHVSGTITSHSVTSSDGTNTSTTTSAFTSTPVDANGNPTGAPQTTTNITQNGTQKSDKAQNNTVTSAGGADSDTGSESVSRKAAKENSKKIECERKGKVAKQIAGIWQCVDSDETKAANAKEKADAKIRDAYFDDINKIHRAYNNKLRQLQKKKK